MGGGSVTLGLARRHGDLFDPVVGFCDEQLGESSIYGLLHRERDRLFPDEMFADLYQPRGRRSVPPSVLACVLVLQRLEGLSDREATDRFTYDARWRYACGVGGWDTGWTSFDHSVLVRFRMRLEDSADPRRIFRVSTAVAAEAGLIGIKRVLDSAPLFDAVATQDTVTLIRSAVRGLLRAADPALGARLRAVLSGEDDYAGAGKPACDWDDSEARSAVVDRLARDGLALLGVLEARSLSPKMAEAAELLALVIGQDLEQADDGTFRIARKVAKDRIISTVDPDARHGHKTAARRFDGYKGHIAADPDSEIVTDTVVGPANGGDGHMTEQLTSDLDPDHHRELDATSEPDEPDPQTPDDSDNNNDDGDNDDNVGGERPAVYGDAAYGSGDNLAGLEQRGIEANTKVQPPASRGGRFTKDAFDIDLEADTVSCPGGHTAMIRRDDHGDGIARFGANCHSCPLRSRCTTAKAGRAITVSRHERLLAQARRRQQDPAWRADYRATRPKVERKLAHMLRPGRRARRRGTAKVDADWNYLGAAINYARMARLGLRNIGGSWQIAPA
jgi:transposase